MKRKFASLSRAMLRDKPPSQEDDNPSILALQDIGILPGDLSDCRAFHMGAHQYLAYPGDGLKKIYPWTREELLCPWCGDFVKNSTIVDHPHEDHVRTREITLQEVSEWIEEMEWECDGGDLDDGYKPADDHRHYARAVYFDNIFEWQQVLNVARKHGLSVNSFLAAAVRFVMRYPELSLAAFAYPDPTKGLEFIPQIPRQARLDEQRANEKEREQKQKPEKPRGEAT